MALLTLVDDDPICLNDNAEQPTATLDGAEARAVEGALGEVKPMTAHVRRSAGSLSGGRDYDGGGKDANSDEFLHGCYILLFG